MIRYHTLDNYYIVYESDGYGFRKDSHVDASPRFSRKIPERIWEKFLNPSQEMVDHAIETYATKRLPLNLVTVDRFNQVIVDDVDTNLSDDLEVIMGKVKTAYPMIADMELAIEATRLLEINKKIITSLKKRRPIIISASDGTLDTLLTAIQDEHVAIRIGTAFYTTIDHSHGDYCCLMTNVLTAMLKHKCRFAQVDKVKFDLLSDKLTESDKMHMIYGLLDNNDKIDVMYNALAEGAR